MQGPSDQHQTNQYIGDDKAKGVALPRVVVYSRKYIVTIPCRCPALGVRS